MFEIVDSATLYPPFPCELLCSNPLRGLIWALLIEASNFVFGQPFFFAFPSYPNVSMEIRSHIFLFLGPLSSLPFCSTPATWHAAFSFDFRSFLSPHSPFARVPSPFFLFSWHSCLIFFFLFNFFLLFSQVLTISSQVFLAL